MHQELKSISLSHKLAPVEVREMLALSNEESARLLHLIRDISDVTEALIVSTCNRTEVYYVSETDLHDAIIKLLGIIRGVQNIDHYHQYFEFSNDNEQTIRGLYRVSMGLDSNVLGDLQISNQIKKAYQLTADENMAGPYLHRLLHAIFYCNKRVAQETAFRDGAASVSYATKELILELTDHLIQPKILLLGLGEMGGDVARNLMGEDVEVCVTNRTYETAQAIAEECNYRVENINKLPELLQEADVVVSSVAVKEPFLTKESFAGMEILLRKYCIDMSVPRSIAPEVSEVPGIELYNIDTIQTRTNQALEKRRASIPDVERIIEDSIDEFLNWSRELEVSPTIQKLKKALEEIRQSEINRYMKNLSEKENIAVDKVTKGIMQKIIKLPILQLKAACQRGEAETLIDVLNDLFNLEALENKVK